jgi:hypothetical protein
MNVIKYAVLVNPDNSVAGLWKGAGVIPDGYYEINEGTYGLYQDTQNNLDQMKKAALNAIDELAGKTRLKYITSVPGQAETYLLKAAQAKALVDAGYVYTSLEAEYPLIAAEVPVYGDVQNTCNAILTAQTQWSHLAAAIEGIRLNTKKKIRDAVEIAELISVFETGRNSMMVI